MHLPACGVFIGRKDPYIALVSGPLYPTSPPVTELLALIVPQYHRHQMHKKGRVSKKRKKSSAFILKKKKKEKQFQAHVCQYKL